MRTWSELSSATKDQLAAKLENLYKTHKTFTVTLFNGMKLDNCFVRLSQFDDGFAVAQNATLCGKPSTFQLTGWTANYLGLNIHTDGKCDDWHKLAKMLYIFCEEHDN